MEDFRSDGFGVPDSASLAWPEDDRFPGKAGVVGDSTSAYQHLKHLLLTGFFRAGERIDVNWAASAIGVSATPVREALIRLSSERLVIAHANRGFFYPVPRAETLADELKFRFSLSSLCWNSLGELAIADLNRLTHDSMRLRASKVNDEAEPRTVVDTLDHCYLMLSKCILSACAYREMLGCTERTLVVRRCFIEKEQYRIQATANAIDLVKAIMIRDKGQVERAISNQLGFDLEAIPFAVERLRSRSFDLRGTRPSGADRA
ncbi:GntR family transcriptional regulator [Rhizobium leguminosarum]|uniref:GntR family transcriptional regulator n=1 Tax=Rhizobium leguminosarum TaxID=384 RepID=UPI001C97CD61|nr:GntR family transcriptional regulator [Rhizobium leguminosarum]MBY5361917.1 GntR family transcriptional regulator [Rhizobium leguminosarum]MBY5664947.1 GntR family transcriptional regulator [Rhizobium leguminosarum]MBY5677569.1 GntR family transcriptional regulator [Rhizobium leguminosarum]